MLTFINDHALAESRGNWVRELDDAQKALEKQQYSKAYKLYSASATHNPLAQFTLGMFYREGWGRAVDGGAACKWFEQSAQQHIPTAEHFFGDCLSQGIGRNADIPNAIQWYEKAASHGHLISQCSIADFYIQGKGVVKDVSKGLALCTQVAQANSPPAMLKLAAYYQQGQYVPQDLVTARYWYQQAAEKQIPEAQFQLGMMMMQSQGGEADWQESVFWLETAASQGYAPAYLPTAVLYANAPLQQETGALAPEYLAKIYLWLEAAKALSQRSDYASQQALITKIESNLQQILPPSWKPALDQKVSTHLLSYPVALAPETLKSTPQPNH